MSKGGVPLVNRPSPAAGEEECAPWMLAVARAFDLNAIRRGSDILTHVLLRHSLNTPILYKIAHS